MVLLEKIWHRDEMRAFPAYLHVVLIYANGQCIEIPIRNVFDLVTLTYDLDLWTWPRYPSIWPPYVSVVRVRHTLRLCQNYSDTSQKWGVIRGRSLIITCAGLPTYFWTFPVFVPNAWCFNLNCKMTLMFSCVSFVIKSVFRNLIPLSCVGTLLVFLQCRTRVTLGSYHFLPGGGASVCDPGSPIFSGPPLGMRKKFWSPMLKIWHHP